MCLCKVGMRGPWLFWLLAEAPEAVMSFLAATLGATFAAGGIGAFFFFVCWKLAPGVMSQDQSKSSSILPPRVSSTQMSSSATGSIFFLDEAPEAAGFEAL